MFDVGAGVVECVEVGGGDGDEPDEVELGVTVGEFAFACFDVAEAFAFSRVDPEPFALFQVGVCFAGHHFHVEKSVSGGRTAAKVRRLEGEPRLEAIALMLGGRTATEASRRHAKELMESI